MPPKKQYLKVKRVSIRDVFLLFRVDLADGKRFHAEDVVVACPDCRRVSKRTHWLMAGNVCPFCGCQESMAFEGKKSLIAQAQPPVVYASRKFPARGWPGRLMLIGAALILLLLILLPLFSGGKAGFFRAGDGRFYYQDSQGERYHNGDYAINGQVFHFENGLLAGEGVFEINRVTQITDENGRLRQGWYVYQHQYVFLSADGVVKNRVPETAGAGFYDLDGLGRVFVTAQKKPGNGWILYDNGLYHLADGQASPLPDLPGAFTELGKYCPGQDGFVETMQGAYFVESDGQVRTGFVTHAGFVYLMDQETGLRRILREGEIPHVTTGADGSLIPDQDMLFDCQIGPVIAQARTGAVKTGWILLDGSIYFADASGALRRGQENQDPRGAFDAQGRFLPETAGRVQMGALSCYMNDDGTLATGAVKDGDYLYLFDDAGMIRANASIGAIGATDAQGALHPYNAGMITLEGASYCLSQQGVVLTGWLRVGKLYYFDPATGCRVGAGSLVNGIAYPLSRDGYFCPAVEGVYQLGDASYYVMTDGSLAVGWRAVEGTLCYFDEQTGKRMEDGSQANQTGWVQKSATRFYVFEDGRVARGWQLIDSKVYYFDLQTGAAVTGSQRLDGKIYQFREDGVLMPDQPLTLTLSGVSVRIGQSGSPEGGYLYTDGHLYYYDPDTAQRSASLPDGFPGWISALGGYLIPEKEGLTSVGAGVCYLDSAGNALTGWFVRDDQLYYADPATGFIPANGKSQEWSGAFQDGVFTPNRDGVFLADGREYVFAGGKLTHGWVALGNGLGYVEAGLGRLTGVTRTIDGVECRFASDGYYIPGSSGNRLLLVQGQWTLILENGTLPNAAGIYALLWDQVELTPELFPAVRQEQTEPYAVGGYLVAVLAGGKTAASAKEAGLDSRAFTVRSGVIQPVTPGICTLNGDGYLLRADGGFAVGVCMHQRHLYMFSETDGKMVRNASGFGQNGVYVANGPGVVSVNRNPYYMLDSEGTVALGFFEDAHQNVRYAHENGILATGLTTINGARYCFGDATTDYIMKRNEYVLRARDVDGAYYDFYAGADGRLATGWQEIGGTLRYFDEDGHMLYDIVQDGRYINGFGEAVN